MIVYVYLIDTLSIAVDDKCVVNRSESCFFVNKSSNLIETKRFTGFVEFLRRFFTKAKKPWGNEEEEIVDKHACGRQKESMSA